MNNKDWKKWFFWFTFAVASIIVYKTIDSVSSIFTFFGNLLDVMAPFLMAILVAYILYMPSKKIEQLFRKSKNGIINKCARWTSVLIVYILAITIVFVIFKFIIPSISTSVTDLTKNVPNYFNSAINYFNNLDDDNILSKLQIANYIKALQETNWKDLIIESISIESVSQSLKSIVGATNIIFDAFVTLIVSFYLLIERNSIKEFLIKFADVAFDEKTNKVLSNYYRKTNGIFFNFITSQLIDAFVVGIITSVVMSIMHVKYAVLLGFLIGLFNIIPYFGAIIGITLSIIITIFTGGIPQALWLALVIIILQQIDANIINPKILGTSLNLSPILVIFSVTIGGRYFGIPGMFLGVPAMALIKLIVEDIVEYRKNKKTKKDYIERA